MVTQDGSLGRIGVGRDCEQLGKGRRNILICKSAVKNRRKIRKCQENTGKKIRKLWNRANKEKNIQNIIVMLEIYLNLNSSNVFIPKCSPTFLS